MKILGFSILEIGIILVVGAAAGTVPVHAGSTPAPEHTTFSTERLPDGSCGYLLETTASGALPTKREGTYAPGEVGILRIEGGNPSFLALRCDRKDGLVVTVPSGTGDFITIRPAKID